MFNSELQNSWSRISPSLPYVIRYVQDILIPFCDKHSYPFVFRSKDIESMLLKIETGRYKRLTEIDDLVAGTIITPTLRGHDDIISFLAENFHIREERARENVPFNPSIFRFDSTRVYFTLDLSDHTNGDPIASKIICELQIRTALEHAWIAALHDLVYKAEQLDWQKERLSAQLKAELETLDLVLYNFDEVAARIPKRRWDRFDELNAIVGIIEELKEEQHLPTEIIPKNLKRVAENI